MRVEIKIDRSCTGPKIIILTAFMTVEVTDIVQKLSDNLPRFIMALKNKKAEVFRNSETINLKKGNNFDLSLTGAICVRLSDGTVTYVSRQYVPKKY